MVLSIKAAAAAGYYFQANGLEARAEYANGQWYGRRPGALGVESGTPVELRTLDQLLRRRTAFNESPTFDRSTTSTGRDFVFSAPKSVSIVWAFASQKTKETIEDAQIAAVKASVDVLMDEACRERCGKGGAVLRPAYGVVAMFNHIATRTALHEARGAFVDAELSFPDPNLHTHVVMPDIVASHSGRLKVGYTALHTHWSMALGAWYHAALAFYLREAGVSVTGTGNNGLFQIQHGKNDDGEWHRWSAWIAGFSARTTGPTGALGRRPAVLEGATLPETKAKAFERTRARAIRIDGGQLAQRWNDYAEAIGVSIASITATTPQTCIAPDAVRKTALFRTVVEDASANDAVLQTQDLCRALASRIVVDGLHFLPTMGIFKELATAFDENQQALLTELGASRAYGFSQWTAAANGKDEAEVEDIAATLFRSPFPAPKGLPEEVTRALSDLTAEQHGAAREALSPWRLTIVSGAPGTGKTTVLGPVIRVLESNFGKGCVIGASEAWQPALALKRAFGIEAHSLAQLLIDHKANKVHIGPKTILIVDEAGLLPTKRMRTVLQLALEQGAKLILVGDDGQLNPIGAGSGMRLVRRAAPTPIEPLTTILRQKDGAQRAIVEGLVALRQMRDGTPRHMESDHEAFENDGAAPLQAAHKIADAMIDAKRWTSFGDADRAVKRIVEALADSITKRHEGIPPAFVLVRSNREVHHVTRLLRDRLRKDNYLQGDDAKVRIVTPMGATMRLRLAVGDHIRFHIRNRRLKVYNGTCAKVIGIDHAASEPIVGEDRRSDLLRLTVLVDDPRDAREVDGASRVVTFPISEFCDDRGRARIGPAYAGTVYGSQGMTVEHVIVLKSAAMTFRELYVASTRARESCEIVEVNAKRAFLQGIEGGSKSLKREIAHELTGAARRDRPKANAQDHPLRNARDERENNWPFNVLIVDGNARLGPLNNGRNIGRA